MQSNDVKAKIIEFLKFNGYTKTIDKLLSEQPVAPQKRAEPLPKIYSFFDGNSLKQGRAKRIERELQNLKAQSSKTLEQARAIFTIAVSCLQHLHNLKEGSVQTDGLGEAIESYKVDLGKYHKILLTEQTTDPNTQLFSEAILQDYKNKIVRAKQEMSIETIVEVLLSLRVNALQIAPEQRLKLITELVKNDIFLI